MAIYEEGRVKLTNSELKEIKSAAKIKTGTTLRITQKNFQDEELPYELFLATRKKKKEELLWLYVLSVWLIDWVLVYKLSG